MNDEMDCLIYEDLINSLIEVQVHFVSHQESEVIWRVIELMRNGT